MNIREEHYNKVAIEGLNTKIAAKKSNVKLQRILFCAWAAMIAVTTSVLTVIGN